MGLHLIGTAGVEHADLGRANTAATLVLANAICEVVVGSTERASAIVAHPRAAGARRDLEADAVVGRRIRHRRARTRIGGKKGSGNSEKTQKHVYKYNLRPWF